MKSLIGLWCILILITFGDKAVAQKGTIVPKASVIKFGDLTRLMSAKNDTTYIFNFFATWCVPCIEEFPDFQKFSENNSSNKIKVVFVSLDFRKDFRKSLLPFLKKRNVNNEVVLLDEPDYNSWIDKVDSSWDGNLPATLVINNRTHIRKMYAREFTYSSLDSAMKPFIQ